MTTDFYIKRRCFALFTCIMVFTVAVLCSYAYSLTHAQFVRVNKSFYFLVSTDTHIESTTHMIRLDGGAGYLLMEDDTCYTAYSVYLNGDIGLSAQEGLQEETMLVEKNVGYLIFKGKNKLASNLYQGALNALYGCIDVLSQSIDLLENGGIQQTCKRILTVLERQFAYMASEYQASYPAFSSVCKGLQVELSKLAEKIVLCKDLRYVLCAACDGYIQLTKEFSL